MGAALHHCNKCGENKPRSEFWTDSRYREHPRSYCKACAKSYAGHKRETDNARVKKMERDSKKRRRVVAEDAQRGYWRFYSAKRNYGITEIQFRQMHADQNGKCATCSKEIIIFGTHADRQKLACIDHCHKTGMVRGLLCNQCNLVVGYLGDSIDVAKRIIIYLRGEK